MKKSKFPTIFACLAGIFSAFSTALAQGYMPPPRTSLFFTQKEAREAEKLARQSAPAGQGEIQLGAVIYYAPDDWAFWLQNEKWTPNTLREDLQVLEVTADEVRLVWRGGGGSQEVTLRPYQSFKMPAKKYTKR